MTTDNNVGVYVSTAPVRLVYTDTLFTAKPFKENGKEKGEPKFSVQIVFKPDHPDLKVVKEAIVATAKAAWPGVAIKDVTIPIKSGTAQNEKRVKAGKKAAPYMEGAAFITARSKYAPVLSCKEKGSPLVTYSGDNASLAKSKFFSGVEAIVEIKFVANEVNGNKSVTAYPNAVCSLNRGERLGQRDQSEVFRGYLGSATDEDPTGGGSELDDEIPF